MENCKAEELSSGQNSIPLGFQPESHLRFPGPAIETSMPFASTTERFATAETRTCSRWEPKKQGSQRREKREMRRWRQEGPEPETVLRRRVLWEPRTADRDQSACRADR